MDSQAETNVPVDSTSKPTEDPVVKQPETNEDQPQPVASSWWGTATSWYDSAVKKLEEVEEKLDEKLDVWVDSAKKKIEETNEFMRRDMGEFAQAVKQDASKIVNSTAEQLNINLNLEEAGEKTRIVTSQIGSFINKVVEKVAPQMPDDDEENLLVGTRKGVKTLDAYQAKIFHLQTNPETYLTGADDEDEYKKFCENFSIDENKEELSGIMLDFKEVRSIYTKLVPDAVTHEDFWRRYFYKKSLIQKAEERRALLAERVDKLNNSSQDLTWDVSDDENEEKEETEPIVKTPKEVEFKSLQDSEELTAPQPESIRISEEQKSEEQKVKSDEQDSRKDLKEENKSDEKKSADFSVDQTNESDKKDAASDKDLPQDSPKKAESSTKEKENNENQTLDGAVEKKQDLINESNDNISNNSKETSSCEIVDIKASEESIKKETSECSDWVEDFGSDIEMSEDEINKINESIQQDDNIGDDWENWE